MEVSGQIHAAAALLPSIVSWALQGLSGRCDESDYCRSGESNPATLRVTVCLEQNPS
jgi:hypothetical protein